MAEGYFTKAAGGVFVPADLETEQALERVKVGGVIHCTWVNKRNPLFLRKFFALIRVGFDLWEPVVEKVTLAMQRFGMPQKNVERYRSDVTVAAGFYDPVFDLHGELRLVPKSIAFGNMDEEEFAQLYSEVINVVLRHVPDTYSQADINEAVERIIGFA